MSLLCILFSYKFIIFIKAVVAEWLRRLTRNQIPSGSVGSNPTDCELLKKILLDISDHLETEL